MNWEAIIAVAELIGLVFIILSVFYLAKQVKLGNKQTITDSLSDAIKLYIEQYNNSYGTEKNVVFMRKALNDYTCLSQDEKGRLFSIIIGYVGAWDNLHTKYQAGFLPKVTYNSITVAFASLLQTPGGLACIKQIHEAFVMPPHVMDKTIIKSIDGVEVRPFADCLDFLKVNL
ncbi:hypothetical protein [Muriicola sp. Z0-33]|uniref:hypothetical protein n=1 Tax=Muriicola sp. Z0-33 TaxID=2816957 RepID=UPI00223815F6|nr:hypothetical protein [Muriicola sp. Z0-33]MCW5518092.1 hypothetical protein [Muriicola sp. Z0-33]